ncbi:hypothetical protein JSO61_009855 [Riemerella anatipestifer]|uniref:hypothetical protein n=1 Tax=Riemerella anatipestifer TaxID=34085 RepID=UPI0016233D40|nr:hypothetical protein [Riemerella anatipestifer]
MEINGVETNNILENSKFWIQFISAIIVTVISVLSLPHIIQLLSAYGRRKFFNNIDGVEVISFFEKHAPEYYNDFRLPKMIEDDFYINTGIRADIESIKKYTDLKKTTGATWEDIRIAKPYFRIEERGIQVEVSKCERVFSNIVVFVSLSIIILGVIGFILLIPMILEQDGMRNYFTAAFALGLSCFIGYSFMKSVNSIRLAKRVEDNLKKKRKDNTE